MKSCPVCSRTYADDTFTFCLDDGALLSASYDPQSTLQIPAARDTDQPRTEILRAPPATGHQQPPLPPPATAGAPDPISYPRGAVAETRRQNRGGKTSKAVVALIVFLTAGVLLLGYIAWRNSRGASSESTTGGAGGQANTAVVATPTASTGNVVNANAGGGVERKPAGGSGPQWLEGVWQGTGNQHAPKMTWTVKLTAEDNTYAIEYPSLRCGGKWTLVETGERSAKFKEVITRGLERCSSDGDISVERISDDEVSYRYTLPVIGEVATAQLRKRAAH